MLDELATPRDWLRWAVSRFNEAGLYFGHGCDNARGEAVWLIQHVLQLPRDRLDPFFDAKLTRGQCEALFDILTRRIEQQIPAAYLTHEAWLGGRCFYVDERVIVPRSYFAELLDQDLAPWVADTTQIRSALDLCTGSGCLAILMVQTLANAMIDAADISTDALAVAARNVDDYALRDRVRLIESDLFSALAGRQYELIISNPPYVTAASMDSLPAEYRHEPALALAAGDDGLDIVRRILGSATDHLSPQGILMIEVGHNAGLVEAAFPNVPFTWIDTPSSENKIFLLTRQELQDHFA